VGHGTESGTAEWCVVRLGAFPVGLMINFNVRKLKEGISIELYDLGV
jgi:hypothetical protein